MREATLTQTAPAEDGIDLLHARLEARVVDAAIPPHELRVGETVFAFDERVRQELLRPRLRQFRGKPLRVVWLDSGFRGLETGAICSEVGHRKAARIANGEFGLARQAVGQFLPFARRFAQLHSGADGNRRRQGPMLGPVETAVNGGRDSRDPATMQIFARDLGEILDPGVNQQNAERDESRAIEIRLRHAFRIEREGAVDLLREIAARLLALPRCEQTIDPDDFVAIDRLRHGAGHLIDETGLAGQADERLDRPAANREIAHHAVERRHLDAALEHQSPELESPATEQRRQAPHPDLQVRSRKLLARTLGSDRDVQPTAERQVAAGPDEENRSLCRKIELIGTEAVARDCAKPRKLFGSEGDRSPGFIPARLPKLMVGIAAGADLLCRRSSAHRQERLRARYGEPQHKNEQREGPRNECEPLAPAWMRPPLLRHRSWLSLLPRRLIVECTTCLSRWD